MTLVGVLDRYQMEKHEPDGWEYTLSIPYQTDEQLDAITYDDILREADWIADSRHCFIETNMGSPHEADDKAR